jgi:hypothetical protein
MCVICEIMSPYLETENLYVILTYISFGSFSSFKKNRNIIKYQNKDIRTVNGILTRCLLSATGTHYLCLSFSVFNLELNSRLLRKVNKGFLFFCTCWRHLCLVVTTVASNQDINVCNAYGLHRCLFAGYTFILASGTLQRTRVLLPHIFQTPSQNWIIIWAWKSVYKTNKRERALFISCEENQTCILSSNEIMALSA